MNIREIFLLGSIFLSIAETEAVCLDERRPTTQEEFRSSFAVVVGHVAGYKDLGEDPSDPHGITGTVYQIQVLRHLKGTVERSIQLRSENSSSRFPMVVGANYLLFLRKDGETYFIDSCGNSTEAGNATSVISNFGAKK